MRFIAVLLLQFVHFYLIRSELTSVEVGTGGDIKELPPRAGPAHVAVKIRNTLNHAVDMYWDSGTEGKYRGTVPAKGYTASASYEGHVFFFTPQGKPDDKVFEFAVDPKQVLYIIPSDDETDPDYVRAVEEQVFLKDYQERTGRPWLSHYPRDPPRFHMWDTPEIGHVHTVETNHTLWDCIPESVDDEDEVARCRSSEPLEYHLEVVSQHPRVFIINNTLSEAEADMIVELGKPRLTRSRSGLNGGYVDETRTSRTGWINRDAHFIMNTIYNRAADILKLPIIDPSIAEDLQIVYYLQGQEYTPHHDFTDSGSVHSRYITLLFYLNDVEDGGETSFPKANGGKGFAVHPGKGNSVLFYNLLPDGNADDLALHAATPVRKGEKWLCNFWVWDPARY